MSGWAQGGKRSRPLIAAGVYDALKGMATRSAERSRSDAVKRCRWPSRRAPQGVAGPRRHRGRRHLPLRPWATLHRQYGVPTAINVGDYLLGLGYRLVSRSRKELGAATCAADIVNKLSECTWWAVGGPAPNCSPLRDVLGDNAGALGRACWMR
ncbi:MAG: hypothetical protein U0797_29235 [Gemmataceae bacterium]